MYFVTAKEKKYLSESSFGSGFCPSLDCFICFWILQTHALSLCLPYFRTSDRQTAGKRADWLWFLEYTVKHSLPLMSGMWGKPRENVFLSWLNARTWWYMENRLLFVQANSYCYLKNNQYDKKHMFFTSSVWSVRLYSRLKWVCFIKKNTISNLTYSNILSRTARTLSLKNSIPQLLDRNRMQVTWNLIFPEAKLKK